jgi:hypothetical protein
VGRERGLGITWGIVTLIVTLIGGGKGAGHAHGDASQDVEGSKHLQHHGQWVTNNMITRYQYHAINKTPRAQGAQPCHPTHHRIASSHIFLLQLPRLHLCEVPVGLDDDVDPVVEAFAELRLAASVSRIDARVLMRV